MFRLTKLSSGGGCGCKIAPQVLSKIIADQGFAIADKEDFLIGNTTLDDAAAYRLNTDQVLLATTDFFTPIVDEPRDFGQIAATNAISDVYAMGGKPLLALNLLSMPVDKVPAEIIAEILQGGADICRQAGAVIGGGHSIDIAEPVYGLAVIGVAHPDCIKTNSQARDGDVLILGKPLGIGILSAALRKDKLHIEDYQVMLQHTTQLNVIGTRLGELPQVHALTDVTGFGLLGHLNEMCQGSSLGARLYGAQVPYIEAAKEYLGQGIATGAAERNQKAYQKNIEFAPAVQAWQKSLWFDPQTSGGLLTACAPDKADEVLSLFKDAGFHSAAKIGVLDADCAGVIYVE